MQRARSGGKRTYKGRYGRPESNSFEAIATLEPRIFRLEKPIQVPHFGLKAASALSASLCAGLRGGER